MTSRNSLFLCTTQSPTEQEHSIYAADMMLTSVQFAKLREDESQNKLSKSRHPMNVFLLQTIA